MFLLIRDLTSTENKECNYLSIYQSQYILVKEVTDNE